MKNLKGRGFTLVEVMVVVAIIGILSAVLLPQISNLTRKARVAKAQSEIKNISTAVLMYRDDNGGNWPPVANRCDAQDLNTYLVSVSAQARYLEKPIGTDPYMRNYRYRRLPCDTRRAFIMSLGEDGGCSGGWNYRYSGTGPYGDDTVVFLK